MAPSQRLPVGHAPFRLFPDYMVDRDGTVNVVDLCEVLSSVASVVAWSLDSDGDLVLTATQRHGLVHLSLTLSDAFKSLGDLTHDAIERAASGAQEAETAPPRARHSRAGVPDLTVPSRAAAS